MDELLAQARTHMAEAERCLTASHDGPLTSAGLLVSLAQAHTNLAHCYVGLAQTQAAACQN